MAFDKQTGKEAGKKSKRGADNQLKELRGIFSELLNNNTDNLQKWFDEIAKDNPAKALELMLKMSSFIIPKPRTIEIKDTTEPMRENKVQIVFEDITDDHVKSVIDKLENKYKE